MGEIKWENNFIRKKDQVCCDVNRIKFSKIKPSWAYRLNDRSTVRTQGDSFSILHLFTLRAFTHPYNLGVILITWWVSPSKLRHSCFRFCFLRMGTDGAHWEGQVFLCFDGGISRDERLKPEKTNEIYEQQCPQ